AFDLREHEFAAVSGEDRLQQLVDDVGAVYEFGLGQELCIAADVRNQDRCALSHGRPSSKESRYRCARRLCRLGRRPGRSRRGWPPSLAFQSISPGNDLEFAADGFLDRNDGSRLEYERRKHRTEL